MISIKKISFKKRLGYLTILVSCCIAFVSWINLQKSKPILYLIGDSTVSNGSGWGKYLSDYFDSSQIDVDNYAVGGTSSRTFQTNGVRNPSRLKKGMWDSVLVKLKPGDFVLMQFGHNDNASLNDTARARGSLKGTGNETKEIFNPITKKQEIVHTYGWYMRKFITDAKSKGAIPIVCSPVSQNKWEQGRVLRNNQDYGKWAMWVAAEEKVSFIDLNEIIANVYDSLGEEKVKDYFSPKDKIHPLKDGNILNAQSVIKGISFLDKCELKLFLNNKGLEIISKN